MILGYLKKCAESYLGEDVKEAVITVPAHFGDHAAPSDERRRRHRRSERPPGHQRADGREPGVRPAPEQERQESPSSIWAAGRSTSRSSRSRAGFSRSWPRTATPILGGEDFDARVVDWLAGTLPRDRQAISPWTRRAAEAQGGRRTGQARAVVHGRDRDQHPVPVFDGRGRSTSARP